MAINTACVKDRRKLRFESTQNALVEVDRLVAVERQGQLTQLGNWSLQQILGHLTASIDNSFNPVPLAPPPWIMRFLGRLFRGYILNSSLRPGFKVGRIDGKMFCVETRDLDDAAGQYRAALPRLNRETPAGRHVLFGPLSQAEWLKFHLRHAELHLGFLTETNR